MSNFDNTENDAPDISAPVIEDEAEERPTLPYTMKLRYPVSIEGKSGKRIECSELVFKNRCTARMKAHLPLHSDAMLFKRGHLLPILAAMTGEMPFIIDALDSADEDEALSIVLRFFR